MEDGNVNKRLEEAIDRLGMTGRAFSEKTGIDSSNLSKKLQGKVKITRNDFRAIRENTAINVDWLVTGMGPMLTEEGGADSKPRPKGVPYFNVDFNLGFEDMYEVPETVEYYIDVPGMNKATCWCRTTGNSMSPLINSGDLICLDEIEDWQSFINNDDIYAIVSRNGLRTVKRVVETEDRKGLRLIPINKEYHEQTIEKDMVYKIYHVIGTMKSL